MDRLDQLERARARARGVRMVKLAGENRYLARSQTYEPGSYFELWVSPWGHVRCTCPGFTYRGICKHAETLRDKPKAGCRVPDEQRGRSSEPQTPSSPEAADACRGYAG